MAIYKLIAGDRMRRDNRSLVIQFAGRRKVLSTSFLNGGYREDLEGIFNYCEDQGSGEKSIILRAPTLEEHMRIIAGSIGLDPGRYAGLSTAIPMTSASIKGATYDDFSVTAIVTGGIAGNSGRVGDRAEWHEKEGRPAPVKAGTINTILLIDADLSAGAMARTLVTCTEAKTAALQELLAPSRYSRGLATGTGTDGVIAVSNAAAAVRLAYAGKHGKLGEYIGRVVKEAVKEALYLHNRFSYRSQHSVVRRLGRFGIDEQALWERCCLINTAVKRERAVFERRLRALDRQGNLVARASLYAHLLDHLDWRMLDPAEAQELGCELLKGMAAMMRIPFNPPESLPGSHERALRRMVDNFIHLCALALVMEAS